MISEKGREDYRTNIIGLIPEDSSCQCELHGFEIDMDGNVLTPLLCPDRPVCNCKEQGLSTTKGHT